MKTSIKLFALGTLLLGFGINANAQTPVAVTSTAALASATILTPIAIVKNADLNFGNVIASATAGTIVYATDGTRTANLGASLHSTAGSPSIAQFTVSGSAGFSFSVSVPASITLTSGSNGPTMGVSILKDFGTSENLGDGGTKVLKVGGTLSLAANQAAGSYTNSSDLKVTVNYN
jgi:hypothetical protein